VTELAALVGFRSLNTTARPGATSASHDGLLRIADRVSDIIARREAAQTHDTTAAERWLDEGGSFSPAAVAVAIDATVGAGAPAPGRR
jgi:hypothetical protein